MNVLAVVRWPVGGIKTYLRYVYGHSVFESVKVTLLAPDYNVSNYFKDHIKSRGVVFKRSGERVADLIVSLRNELKSGDYDIVHSHGFTAALIAAPICHLYKMPHLITAHDIFLERQFIGLKGKLKYFVMRWVLERADRVHAVSIDAKINICKFFPSIDKEKIEVVLHGIDVDTFSNASPARLRLERGPEQDNLFVFGFLGRFMAPKGFRTLIDAVDYIVKNDRATRPFCVATFGWGGFIREDYEQIEKLGIGQYFCQLSQTDNVASAIKALDAVVMPSRWEACGLLGMEVLTAGRPLIASRCVGLREVIQDTPALSFEVDNAEELAEHMLYCMNNEGEQKELAERYISQAKLRFCHGKAAKGLLAIYESMLKTPSLSY